MNQNGDEFEPPPFDNFSLVGGPNQSISNSWDSTQNVVDECKLWVYTVRHARAICWKPFERTRTYSMSEEYVVNRQWKINMSHTDMILSEIHR